MSILRGTSLAALLLLVSCTSQPSSAPPQDAAGTPGLTEQLAAAGGLPAVPQGRLASAAFVAELDGAGSWECSGNAVPDGSALQLKYVQALDSTGKSWGAPEVVDTIGWVGNYSSLAEIDGRPAISCQDSDTGSLMFAIRLEP